MAVMNILMPVPGAVLGVIAAVSHLAHAVVEQVLVCFGDLFPCGYVYLTGWILHGTCHAVAGSLVQPIPPMVDPFSIMYLALVAGLKRMFPLPSTTLSIVR